LHRRRSITSCSMRLGRVIKTYSMFNSTESTGALGTTRYQRCSYGSSIFPSGSQCALIANSQLNSAQGQSRHFSRRAGSGLPRSTDIVRPPRHVGLVPLPDSCTRRPSHRQAIGDVQCQAVSDDLRLAQPSRAMRPQGPRVEVISRRNISRKHGFGRCGLSIKAGGSAALA
jgi:hypothetical protein